jgi:hypothetical protein
MVRLVPPLGAVRRLLDSHMSGAIRAGAGIFKGGEHG